MFCSNTSGIPICTRKIKYPFEYLGKSLEEILKPLEIDIPEFDNICDRFTNKQIFKLDEDGNILKDNYKRPIKLAYDN